MVTRVKLFYLIALVSLVGALIARADPAPDAKPARGTVEYAKTHALYAPAPQLPPEVRARHLSGSGLFALHLRPDGTVSDVQTLRSTGHQELDAASIAAFSKWRFYPRQTKLVKIPITYTGRYTGR
jgi:TonB family protein